MFPHFKVKNNIKNSTPIAKGKVRNDFRVINITTKDELTTL